ncbi:MAG TPA: acetate/propionate family kinase [Nocardioides sp.]|nr:acetate/propionate family kinase [Nocardioides sp.]
MTSTDLVLVLNAGSSSLKYQVIGVPDGASRLRGHVERLEHGGFDAAFEQLTSEVDDAGLGADLVGVGHRVVHGGARHTAPERVDDDLLASIDELSALAPLHNPPALEVLRLALDAWPALPHVAVFDTAFFADLPPAAATPAIDRQLAADTGIRRFGMHGTSHAWVAARAADHLGRRASGFAVITLHLGNGASAAAIRDGRPLETSMGFTPLEGLVMGSRGGDLDPGVLLHLLHRGWDATGLSDLLHHRSGLQGLAGTSDFRDLLGALDHDDGRARLAYDVYCLRLRKYVGAYLAVLGGADAIVFTGGVGENVPRLRSDALRGLDPLGIEVDDVRNDAAGAGPATISPDRSRVAVLVVPTDEERAIAQQVHTLLRSAQD